MYKIRIVCNDSDLDEVEQIRKEAFHLKENAINTFKKHIENGKMIAFSLETEEDEKIGGCYLGEYNNTLYVYYLFLKESYQRSGKGIGRRFLLEIFNHKKAIELILKHNYEYSSLHPTCTKLTEMYKEIGYQEQTKGYYVKRI